MDKTALAAHLAIRKFRIIAQVIAQKRTIESWFLNLTSSVSGPGVKTQQVLLQASHLVRSRFNVFEMTLQIEEFEAGMEDCAQCQDPLD